MGKMVKPIRTHTFCGKNYDVDITDEIDGLCDSPQGTKPSLILCCNLKTRAGLITAIHESLHACSFLTSEERVTQTANDIGSFLWRLNYRIGDSNE